MDLEEIAIVGLVIAIALYFIGKYLYEKYGDDDQMNNRKVDL